MDTTKIRVLIADDHPVVRAGLRALLESEPDMAVVGETATGAEAVAHINELRPDVVIMDISMPTNGIDATRQVRAVRPETKVLVLTIHAHESYLFRAIKAGASGYVLKSAVDTELIDAVRIIAQGGAFLYPTATKLLLDDYLAHTGGGDDPDSYGRLSDREREVLRLIALGHTASEIARQLVISAKSVETYRARILQKLDLHSRADVVKYALSHHLISEEDA